MNTEYIKRSLIYARDFNQGLYLTREDVPELLNYLDAIEPIYSNAFPITSSYDADSVRYTMAMALTPKEPVYVPTQIFVNNGVTVCKFADGEVITSKPREGEPFDPEVGVAMCIVKKLFRGRGRWLSYLRDKVKYQERKVKK